MLKKNIGVFDSGIGGLTVLKELRKQLPNEKIIYFGDTARVPYGSKSKETVIRYSLEITKFLLKKNIKILVVACNTASAFALNEIEKIVNIPVIGVIEPGSRRASKTTKNDNIGVIGTKGTIKSNSYFKEIRKIRKDAKIYQKPCPLFVPLIEEGMFEDSITLEMSNRYLADMSKNIDTLVLGCTHYPLIKNIIKKVVGNNIILIDSAEETAIDVRNCLYNKRLLRDDIGGEPIFYLSDYPDVFSEVGEMFLGEKLNKIEIINLEN